MLQNLIILWELENLHRNIINQIRLTTKNSRKKYIYNNVLIMERRHIEKSLGCPQESDDWTSLAISLPGH